MVDLLFGSGWILHLLLIAILYLMWRSAGTLSLDELIDRDTLHHHLNSQYHQEHQKGGSWDDYRLWLKENQRKSSSNH